MRKQTAMAMLAAMGLAVAGATAFPVQAAAENDILNQLKVKGYAVVNGQVTGKEELKDLLGEIYGQLGQMNWEDCIIIPPVANDPEPDIPEMDAPETDTPETDVPETDMPETDVPGIDVPETDMPETDMPGTDVPETDMPETDVPETDMPETDTPETNVPETNVPETDVPETDAPETENPGEDAGNRTYEEQVAALVNEERAKAGLSPVTVEKEMESAAFVRAKETEIQFSHTRPDGRHFSTALSDAGVSFRGAGENIAWGQRTPEEVMKGWMNSEGHRANILNPSFTKIGVGYYQNATGRNYWTQLFAY